MKILFTRFPLESTLGGAEIQTLSLMEGLLERGHAVAFAGSCPVLLAECRKRHIPAVELEIGPPPVTKGAAVSFMWRKARMRGRLERLLDAFEGGDSRLDALCMLSLSEKLLLTGYAASKGTKIVWIEHDRIGRWLTQNPWLPLLKEQSRHAIIVPVSHLSGKMYEELGFDAGRIRPIPNGVDGKRLAGGRGGARRKMHDARFRLGCISRLSPEKGVDLLIEAMAGAPGNVTLEIVGAGREEGALKKLAEDLQLSERITFTPHEADVSAAYTRFDALVLPSRDHDPFGLVAAEAMMCSLPVIVTDRCGIAPYLESGRDALVCDAGSISSLTDAITRLLDARTYATLAENGLNTAEEKFSVKSMVEKYEAVFTGGESSPPVS